jgi:hypothetical protein
MTESAPRRPPMEMPPYLRVIENGPLKPDVRAEDVRMVERHATLPPGVLTAPNDGMWE